MIQVKIIDSHKSDGDFESDINDFLKKEEINKEQIVFINYHIEGGTQKAMIIYDKKENKK